MCVCGGGGVYERMWVGGVYVRVCVGGTVCEGVCGEECM